MRGSRVLLIGGVVIFLGAMAVGLIFWWRGRQPPPEPVVIEEEGTVVPEEPEVKIVVAAQYLPRGVLITEDMTRGEAPAVILKGWSGVEEDLPDGVIRRLEDVYNRTTRMDIVPEAQILASMLVEQPPGSSASLQIPEGSVAYALPVARYSSVAWALQPGDYVDVIISLLLLDLDEEFQAVEPNQGRCLSPSDDPACAGMSGPMGRLEVLPNGWLVNLTPVESQRPRLVTQLTVQNALVLLVGDWPVSGEEEPARPEELPAEGEEAEVVGEVTPSAPTVAPLTLAVSRQDAMVLDYAQLTGAHINFVLRRAGDEDRATTESITLEYLMTLYNIEMPPKLPYGVEPRISALETINMIEATTYEPGAGAEE
jgi:Flp pilus assembly protein CpaB